MSLLIEKLFKHPGSDSFNPLKKGIERIQASSEGHANIPDETHLPITSFEYDQSLRFAIQRFKQPELDKVNKEQELEPENILTLNKLLNPELTGKYQKLIESIETKTTVSENYPNREFIDIESEEVGREIENWTHDLIENIKTIPGEHLSEEKLRELEALSWFHFDSLINTHNARSFELDINEFLQASNYYKAETEDQIEIRNELLKNLAKRYPLEKDELEILTELIVSAKDEDSLVIAMTKLWNQYELGKSKGMVAKIMLSHLLSGTIQGIAPFFFQYGIALPTVGLLTGNGVSAYFDLVGELNEAKLMNDVRSKINRRIAQSLIFNKYKFTQDRSLGEIIETLERGKESTITLLSESMSLLFPKTIAIGASLTGLTLINPLLTFINLLSIPITFMIGKAYNRKISPVHREATKAKEKVANELASVKDGIETILTSPNTPKIERSVKDKMDQLDKLTLQRLLYETKLRYTSYFTFSTTQILSALSSLALYWTGKISEGAVFSNVLYSEGISDPFKEMVNKLCKEFPRLRENIRRMERILGEFEKPDLPDGEEEKRRIPVSKLNNFNISIKGLKFKNILKGINLDIKQGDFVTIAGPSGIGKSTLLKNIAGLHQPENGSILIGENNGKGGVKTTDVKKYGDESIYSVMSYANQKPDIFSEMTLRENIVFYNEDTDDDEALKKLLEYLNLNQFTDVLGEKVGQCDALKYLSGGERVRFGLARALYTKPKILLLDEPTQGLDSETALEIRNILQKIHKEGTTIICVTHDEELVKYSSELEKKGGGGKTVKFSKQSKPGKTTSGRKTVT